MNQAPQPPTPEQEAARLNQEISRTAERATEAENAAYKHHEAAEDANQQAAEADMRRSEVSAQAAALSVNAVVNTHELLSVPGRKFTSTKAERYDVEHPEADRQSVNYRAANRDGRDMIWTGTSSQHANSKHNNHEGARAKALGMEHENKYPWHRIEKAARGTKNFLTRGPQRLRRVDPHEKQLQTDFHEHHDDNVMHRQDYTSAGYQAATRGLSAAARRLSRRGDPTPDPSANPHHETATVSDAFALFADRIGQEVRYVTQDENLPGRVAHRKTLGWPGSLKPGQTSHVDIPGIANQEIRDLQNQLQETNDRRAQQGQAPLSFESAYGVRSYTDNGEVTFNSADMSKRLSKEDEALVDTGKHVHQLAFGERDAAEQQKLRKERADNEAAISSLRNPANIRPGDEDVQLADYVDTLTSADGTTLRQLADIRHKQKRIEDALGQPGLTPFNQRALNDQLRDLDNSYARINGAQLTADQAEVRRRGIRYSDLETRYLPFKGARAELQSIDNYIRDNRDFLTPEELDQLNQNRTLAQQRFDTAEADFDPVRDDFLLAHSVRGALARRNEIIELDSRKNQINIVLRGGIEHDPTKTAEPGPNDSNQANRKDVLDYFTDVAERQIDVAARRAAFDATGPGENDSLGREAADRQKQKEEGMLLLAPVDGRRDTIEYRKKLHAFLGDEKYKEVMARMQGAKNGAKLEILNTVIRERMRTIQRAQQTALGEIRDHAVLQDGILREERILLPGLWRAIAARPKVMRKGVETQEAVIQQQREIAQGQYDEASSNNRRAADDRRRLATLQAQRAQLP